ncbi:MAG: nitroreductase family deazaflavin-dependent oxidoreductase [Chloroflexi bacterium]|nr:nitroreductase family deazaflavin-dependent oxidoreductase [Chloroflexota bacterium]
MSDRMSDKYTQSAVDSMNQQPIIPIPRGIIRMLLRLPILFYRLGLGDVMNAAHIMILGTRGRKSGLTRYTPVEYRRHGSKIYLYSAWGERPQWFQNLTDCPEVLVQQGRQQFSAQATVVTHSGEALRVLHLFRRIAPFVYDPLIARLSARERVDARSLPDISHTITIVRIDPIPGSLELHPLPASLVWIWPALLALGVVTTLVIALTRTRSHGDE